MIICFRHFQFILDLKYTKVQAPSFSVKKTRVCNRTMYITVFANAIKYPEKIGSSHEILNFKLQLYHKTHELMYVSSARGYCSVDTLKL